MLSNCHEVFININGQGLELFVHVNIIINNGYVNWAQTDLELKLIHDIVLSNITDWSSWVTQFGRHSVVVNISFHSYLSSVITSFVQCNSLPPSFFCFSKPFLRQARQTEDVTVGDLAVWQSWVTGSQVWHWSGPEDGLSLPQIT